MSRPLCKCHSLEMTKDGRRHGRQEWRCRIKKSIKDYKERSKRISNSLCVKCGTKPIAFVNSDTTCQKCLDNMSLYSTSRTIAKYERLLSLRKDDPEYIAILARSQVNV